jgi:RsiW-degrading membrane proteinase PrsW (M82 family)
MELWRLTSYLSNAAEAPRAMDGEAILIGGMALVGVCGFYLGQIRAKAGEIGQNAVLKPLLVALFVCLGMTLATQAVGRATYGYVAEGERSGSSFRRAATQGAVRSLGSFKKGKGLVFIAAVFAFLMLIGGGYAFTAIQLPLWGHMIAFTVGVGITEELCKLLAVSVLLVPSLMIFRSRASLLPYVMAGLAFGVGESFIYFNSYSDAGLDVTIYLIRAIWCVTLHICWTVIVGRLIIDHLKETPTPEDFLTSKVFDVLLLILPAAALHGIYDAFCVHDNLIGGLIVGMISIGWAFEIFTQYVEPEPAASPSEG